MAEEEREPTPEQRAAHKEKMQSLRNTIENKEQANAPRGMGTAANDPTRKPKTTMADIVGRRKNKETDSVIDKMIKASDDALPGGTTAQKSEQTGARPVRRIQVENVPPELVARPFPLAPMPETKSINRTLGVNLPGASNGVFLLGGTLAIVALWNNVVNPLLDIGWNGHNAKKKISMPASGIISLVLFILLITFISTLSPEFANVAFLFIIGLWAVYLIMNPGVVQNVAGYVSQGNKSQDTSKSDSASGAGSHTFR